MRFLNIKQCQVGTYDNKVGCIYFLYSSCTHKGYNNIREKQIKTEGVVDRLRLEFCNKWRGRGMAYCNLWREGIAYVLALRSHSIKHSRTKIRACTMPRFKRSAEDLLPEYVGRISLPMSSMTAKSWVYLVWGCCDSGGICGGLFGRAVGGGGVPWLPCISRSGRGVPGLLSTEVAGELEAVPSIITSSSIVLRFMGGRLVASSNFLLLLILTHRRKLYCTPHSQKLGSWGSSGNLRQEIQPRLVFFWF